MAAKGGGSIINISSMAATIGMNGIGSLWRVQVLHSSSLTKAWTAEYAAQGIRINTVAPGPTRTPVAAAVGEEVRAMRFACEHTVRGPRGEQRLTRSANAVRGFLASEQASYIYNRDPARRRWGRGGVAAV